mgnify:CR=1 FL=1
MVRWKHAAQGAERPHHGVSILLLVDGALEDIEAEEPKSIEGCFNPTFGGWCAGRP